jgi:hypothetical protein
MKDASPKAFPGRRAGVRWAALAVLPLLPALLAGCGQAPQAQGPAGTGPEAAALHGAVLDPALRPLAGATLTVAGSNATATSDAAGLYRFADLPRGQVLVVTVSHPGHVTASRQATLPEDGDTKLDIVLEPVPTQAAYREVQKFEGTIGCQAAVVASEQEARSADCGGDVDPGETAGDFSVGPRLVSAVVEIVWDAATPLADGLGGRLEMPPAGGAANGTLLAEGVGRSPLRLVVPVQTAERLYAGGGTLRLTVYAMPVTDEDEQAVAAAVAVDQRFQAFASLFYGAPPEPTYSILDG